MRAGKLVRRIASASFLAVSLVILLTLATGRPLVSYASSGSMEPTIGTLDGFLVNPWPGEIRPGDIIVFQSVTRGGPAVHRVVGFDGDGWLTQGDANARIDQDEGEPTVTRETLLGRVVTGPDGEPVVFKGLGRAFLESRAEIVLWQQAVGGPRPFMALVFFLVALFASVPAMLAAKKQRLPPRLGMRTRVLLRRALPRGVLGRHVGFALLLVLVASSAIAAAKAKHEVSSTMIVLQDPSAADDTRAAGPGGELRRDVSVTGLLLIPTTVVLDGDPDSLRFPDRTALLGARESRELTAWQRAGDVVGLQEDVVQVWRYPTILPPSVTLALHERMPGSPYFVLAGAVAIVGAVWFAALRIATLPVGQTLGIREDWL